MPLRLPHLQSFRASNNQLITLSGFPLSSPHLTQLDLSYNSLTSLIGLPDDLSTLQALNLSFNPLESLPINIERCPLLLHDKEFEESRFLIADTNLHTLLGLGWEFYLLDGFIEEIEENTSNYPPAVRSLIEGMWDYNRQPHSPQEIYQKRWEEVMPVLYQEYLPIISDLIGQYLRGEVLSQIQLERIIYEGTYDDFHHIYRKIPDDTVILPAMMQRIRSQKGIL